MKKILFIIFLFSCHSVFAAKFALHFCSKLSNDEKVKFEHQYRVISILEQSNVLLIEATEKPILESPICFISEVKQLENHLAFYSNKIILKLSARDIDVFKRLNQPFLEHSFIKNQYSIVLNNITESEFIDFKFDIEKKLPNSTISINTFFSLNINSVNDPLYQRQYSIENTGSSIQGNGTPDADMQVDSAWTITTGNSSIKIAILDSGVDTLHEDLVNNILPGFDAFASDSLDTKGFPTPNFNSDGHGTACAGIAAAEGNNSLGTAGIAYACKIIPIRFFFYQDYGAGIGVQPTTTTEALLNGAAWAWREANCDIMSISAGLSELFITVLNVDVEVVNEEILAAFYEGRNGFGVPMFFSAGNDDTNDVLWPAELDYTIAVGASTMCDERKNPTDCSSESWGSSYGKKLDVVSPGVLIASSDMTGSNGYSGGNYTNTFNGTSAACPNAAGVGALILSVAPDLHARDVQAVLNLTANKVPNYTYDTINTHGSWNEEVGYGRVNAFEALKLAQTYETTVSISEVENIEISIYPNPSYGIVNFENNSNKKEKIQVFDILGRLIQDFTLEPKSISSKNLSTGMYFIKTNSNFSKSLIVK